MQTQNQLFDDFVKMVNGAAGTLAGMGREAEANARSRAREWFGGLDFVGRDEFEAVKAMAAAARDEADALRARLDRLEAHGTAAPVATGGSDARTEADVSPAAASFMQPGPTIDEVDG